MQSGEAEDQMAHEEPTTTAVVALWPDAGLARALALPGASEPSEKLHLTLAFLGEVAGLDREKVGAALEAFAMNHPPVEGTMNGVAVWNAGEDGYALVALLDAPGLTTWRMRLVEVLAHAGIEVADDHPWIPHVTLAYGPLDDLPPVAPPEHDARFDAVTLAWGDDRTDYPLTGSVVSGQEEATMAGKMETLAQDVPAPESTEDRQIAAPVGEGEFEALLVDEAQRTDDGRAFKPHVLTWRDPPLPLMWTPVTGDGHDGALLGGSITEVRREGTQLLARGVFSADASGQELRRLVEEGQLTWVSIDLGDAVSDLFIGGDGEVTETILSGVVMGATVLPFSAQGGTWIRPAGADAPEPLPVVAAAAPVDPPASWFDDPGLPGPTPLTVNEDGRVFGHAALWSTCHIGERGACLAPPRSGAGYAYFATGAVRTQEGTEIPVGQITLGTGHAGLALRAREASAHYDDTGSAAADVRAGEDEHGIWVAGALRPDVSPEQVRTLRASTLSGDWRRIGGRHEMVALLAVNVPGFPVPRARVASGVPLSLVASGIVDPGLVASVPPFADLPLFPRDRAWDADAADGRVRQWASSDGSGDPATIDWTRYRRAFFFYDGANPEAFGSYKLGFADVDEDGMLKAVPRGVFAVAGVLSGARGGADIPADEQDAIKAQVARYYDKIAKAEDDPSVVPPWEQASAVTRLAALERIVASVALPDLDRRIGRDEYRRQQLAALDARVGR